MQQKVCNPDQVTLLKSEGRQLYLGALLAAGLMASSVFAVEWTTGAPGGSSPEQGLDFPGGGGSRTYVNVPGLDMNTHIQSSDYTMSLWVSPDLIPGESFFLGQTNQGIHHGLRNGGKLHQAHWGADHSGDTTVPSGDGSDASHWVHALYTWDSTAELAQIYFNGVADTAAPVSKRAPNGDGNFIIGSRHGDGGPAFDGQIDDVAVWTRVLSQAEITGLAGGGSPHAHKQNLLGYWNFEDDRSRYDVGDSSGNGFDGDFRIIDVHPPPPLLDPLPGIDGNDGNVGVTVYYLQGVENVDRPITRQERYLLDIEAGLIEPVSIDSDLFPTLAIDDPTSPGGGQIQPKHDLPGGGGNEYIATMKGAFRVTPDQAGPVTFNVQTDDGFGFRINGQAPRANSGGQIEDDVLMFINNTGNSNTTGVWDLPAGLHTFDFMFWEDGGTAFAEVSTALGDFIDGPNNLRPHWLALGDGSSVDERVELLGTNTGVLTEPFTIINVDIPQSEQPLELAREWIYAEIDNGNIDAQSNDNEIFVIDDHNVIPVGCPFGLFNHDGNIVQWPNTTGNRDDFASLILGKFKVDDGDGTPGETTEFTFHVDSDDRAYFRVIGEGFEEVSARDIVDVEGDDVMWADVNTCNTNLSGRITLTEGAEYSFEALHTERGGDAGMQVLVAAGDFLFDPDPDAFAPLALPGGQGSTFAANMGFAFVDPNHTEVPGDYNGDGMVNAADADAQSAAMKDPNPDLRIFDENGDGAVNVTDRNIWVHDHAVTWVGDSNLDGEFNSGDLVGVFTAGKYETGAMAPWRLGLTVTGTATCCSKVATWSLPSPMLAMRRDHVRK